MPHPSLSKGEGSKTSFFITATFYFRMKKISLFILTALISSSVFAQYKPAAQGSTLIFTIKNFGFDVNGTFTGLQGNIGFDPKNPANSAFDVSIDAATVNTDNNLRDQHLQGEDYFDVKNYPRIQFTSTKLAAAGKHDSFTITGKLTIKKQTKVISFPFTAIPSGNGYLFKGTFKINRKDFNVGGTSTIADELEVVLNVLAIKN